MAKALLLLMLSFHDFQTTHWTVNAVFACNISDSRKISACAAMSFTHDVSIIQMSWLELFSKEPSLLSEACRQLKSFHNCTEQIMLKCRDTLPNPSPFLVSAEINAKYCFLNLDMQSCLRELAELEDMAVCEQAKQNATTADAAVIDTDNASSCMNVQIYLSCTRPVVEIICGENQWRKFAQPISDAANVLLGCNIEQFLLATTTAPRTVTTLQVPTTRPFIDIETKTVRKHTAIQSLTFSKSDFDIAVSTTEQLNSKHGVPRNSASTFLNKIYVIQILYCAFVINNLCFVKVF